MITQGTFKPAWWLPGPHLQTIWPIVTRHKIKVPAERERIELPDSDFIDLDWIGNKQQPRVIITHGLGGNISSSYAQRILHTIVDNDWCGVFMHFRGCSGEPNELKRRSPHLPIAAIGYSLGGNVLLKWMGETGDKNPLTAAVAISVPFTLAKSADKINQGFSKFYQWYLLRAIKSQLAHKFKLVATEKSLKELQELHTFWEFDEHVTAPLHGFVDAEDYYQRASSRQYLQSVTVPTLILQAMNDPLVPREGIPSEKELSNAISLELAESGGHVGFITGKYPWQSEYWLDKRIATYFNSFF